jgi:hypothetical protein
MTENNLDDSVESFDINLVPDEGEGGFHTKNNPHQPFQRSTIHEDRRSVGIKCSLIDVVHGRWSLDGDYDDYYATLLVLDFRFDLGNKDRRRITSSKINVIFYGESEEDDHPGVADISLNGSYSLVQTKQTETITSGLDGSVGVNVMSSGQVSLAKKYEKVVSRETSDATYVSGATCMIGVDWDPANAVEWKLRENATLQTGVPAQLRAGILLKRESLDNFKCTVEIDSEVDFKTTVGRWFGGKPKDDPVLFKPSLKPTNRLMQYDVDNLGKFDLSLVEDVTFTTVLDGAVKHSKS